MQRLTGHLPRRRDLGHRTAITDDRHDRLVPLLSHTHLPHQGSVKDQPEQLSSLSRNTVRHQPKPKRQASSLSHTRKWWGVSGLNRRPTDYEGEGGLLTGSVVAQFVRGCLRLASHRLSRVPIRCATNAPQRRVGQGEPPIRSGAWEPAGVVGSRVAEGHRAATRSALDAARRPVDSGAQGLRLLVRVSPTLGRPCNGA